MWTGLAAISTGLLVMVWSIGFIHRPHGRTVFLLLCVTSFLVGGGVGQVVFFLIAWAFAPRTNRPPTGRKAVLPDALQRPLASLWIYTSPAFSLLFLLALKLAIFGILPGVTNPEIILHTCRALLAITLFLMILTFISGFLHDEASLKNAPNNPKT